MKKMVKCILIILLSGKLLSCNNNIQTNEQSGRSKPSDSSIAIHEEIKEQPTADLAGCYMKIVGRDTAILMLEQRGKEFSGKMLYDNHEKDGSRGTVKGKEDGEIIKLWYDFNAEGIRSVMQVYFKKETGRLLRGIGSMDAKTDTTYFISGINYSDKEAFNKVDCSLVEWKLKF
jgi:hypothetical protein